MNRQSDIFRYLISSFGFNLAIVCGIMANIEKESSYRPILCERAKNISMTDESYVRLTDTKQNDFVNDRVGFGLFQLTHPDLKGRFIRFCQSRNKSVGDMETQLDFGVQDMLRVKALKQVFDTASNDKDSAYDVAYNICMLYEKPAKKDTSSISRGKRAEELFREYESSYTYDVMLKSVNKGQLEAIKAVADSIGIAAEFTQNLPK